MAPDNKMKLGEMLKVESTNDRLFLYVQICPAQTNQKLHGAIEIVASENYKRQIHVLSAFSKHMMAQ